MSDLTRLMMQANKVIEVSKTANWIEPILLPDEPRRGPSRDHKQNLTPWLDPATGRAGREWGRTALLRPPKTAHGAGTDMSTSSFVRPRWKAGAPSLSARRPAKPGYKGLFSSPRWHNDPFDRQNEMERAEAMRLKRQIRAGPFKAAVAADSMFSSAMWSRPIMTGRECSQPIPSWSARPPNTANPRAEGGGGGRSGAPQSRRLPPMSAGGR
eukprot:SAG22_NODE_1362_length_4618_cov_3.277495_1_plen_212_part_00